MQMASLSIARNTRDPKEEITVFLKKKCRTDIDVEEQVAEPGVELKVRSA